MKPSTFLSHITLDIEKLTGTTVTIKEVHPEFGGSINESFRIETDHGNFFLKRNAAGTYPKMFECEAKGLSLLRSQSNFLIPQVIGYGRIRDYAYLLMEYVERGVPNPDFWTKMGAHLADLHKNQNNLFGLDYDNYIGNIRQSNSFKESWVDFYTGERIVPMVSMAHERGRIDLDTVKKFEQLCFRMQDFFKPESPSLLHGDLWSGNYLCSAEGEACLIDPAVYYGHREMDLAMMRLFGGFHSDCFRAYEEAYPLEPGWKERVDLCKLYPLLVHVILFGGNYTKQVKQILATYLA